jgi:hypothetical protein
MEIRGKLPSRERMFWRAAADLDQDVTGTAHPRFPLLRQILYQYNEQDVKP